MQAFLQPRQRQFADVLDPGALVARMDVQGLQGGVQLRLGPDGLWYRFGRSFGGWDLVSGPSPDPAALVDYSM